jgi:hypothetical protein
MCNGCGTFGKSTKFGNGNNLTVPQKFDGQPAAACRLAIKNLSEVTNASKFQRVLWKHSKYLETVEIVKRQTPDELLPQATSAIA